MIEFFSSWAKGLGLSIVIISILEMLLPNNNTKKYIRMVMGLYVIFTIISPLIDNKEIFDVNNIDLEAYTTNQNSSRIDQTSMDKRIEELYIEELEKDITKKVEEKGYIVTNCKADAKISDKEEETKINKIKLNIEKSNNEETKNENQDESTNSTENSLENKIITQIQRIKPIDTSINKEETQENNETEEKSKIRNADIQNVKKFLIEEYGVNEKCLEIN